MTFSRREKLLGVLLLVILGYYLMWKFDRRADVKTAAPVLAPGVVEKIVVNPDTHVLTIVKPSGSQNLFLPDRPSSIEIDKTGKATITSRQIGTELHPFFGLTMSDSLRVGVGVDGFYWKKLDLGIGVADRIGNYTPVLFFKGSYLVWDNVQLGLTIDNKQHIGGMLSVRL